MPPLHIAECIEYPIDAFGGTELLVSELLLGLPEEFQLTLVSPDASISASRVCGRVCTHISWQTDAAPPTGPTLAERLQQAGVQIAHFHCGGTFAWSIRTPQASPIIQAARLGIRTLTTNHGFFSPLVGYCAHFRPLWMKFGLFPAAWAAKLASLNAVQCEIAVSDYDRRELEKWYWPQAKKFRRIYHSQLSEMMPRGGAAVREKQILCVGTFGPRKGQGILMDAFSSLAAEFPEWKLLFAGRDPEGSMWKAMQSRIQEEGIGDRVRLVEGLSHEEIAELMRTSEIFVLPSLFEGLGLSLQEALFRGCACIGTKCGGPLDLIDHEENGLLVEKGDPGALAEALRRIIRDDALRARLRERAPQSILDKGMTREAMLRSYTELYRKLAASER